MSLRSSRGEIFGHSCGFGTLVCGVKFEFKSFSILYKYLKGECHSLFPNKIQQFTAYRSYFNQPTDSYVSFLRGKSPHTYTNEANQLDRPSFLSSPTATIITRSRPFIRCVDDGGGPPSPWGDDGPAVSSLYYSSLPSSVTIISMSVSRLSLRHGRFNRRVSDDGAEKRIEVDITSRDRG